MNNDFNSSDVRGALAVVLALAMAAVNIILFLGMYVLTINPIVAGIAVAIVDIAAAMFIVDEMKR